MPDTHVPLEAQVTGSVAASLAAWAAGANAFPDAARRIAGRALVDITGCMVAGAADPAAQIVRKTLAGWGSGNVTVVGQRATFAAPWAAFANGTAAHALDFDDNFDPAKAHITAVLAPALLALAEAKDLSGRAVIDSYIVGAEIAGRLGAMFNPAHRDAGWHATSTLGAIAAAGACAHLLGLEAPRIAHALNAATSFAAGTTAQFGSMTKAVHAGSAAMAGVMAASLAANGLDAGAEAIEIFGVVAHADGAAPDTSTLALVQHGLKVKLYPCCASAHRAIDGVRALRAEHGIEPEQIARIDVHAPASHLANLMHIVPRTPREARFSLGYCLAIAAHRDMVTLADFVTLDAALLTFAARVHGHAVAAPETTFPTRVEIACTDGRILKASIDAPKGRADNPLSDDELWAKLQNCCPHRSHEIAAALHVFDRGIPAAALMTLLRV